MKLKQHIKTIGVSAVTLGALAGFSIGAESQNVEAAEVSYTVESGDTLFNIAENFLGDGWQYDYIAEVNGISNPNQLSVGQTLTFDDGAESSQQSETNQGQEETTTDRVAGARTVSSANQQVPEYVLQVIESEAGPSYQEKLNVFSVIVNRANSGVWGGSDLMSVVTAPGQFEVTWNGMAANAQVSDQTRQAVNDVLANGVTTGAESFRASGDGVTNVFF